MTDGNRRRATQATSGRPQRSRTLAFGEPHDRVPADLFGGPETQSVATYADARWISASRSGDDWRLYESRSRVPRTPSTASSALPGAPRGRSTRPGSR